MEFEVFHSNLHLVSYLELSGVSIKYVDILFWGGEKWAGKKKFRLIFTPVQDLTIMFVICIIYTFTTLSSQGDLSPKTEQC